MKGHLNLGTRQPSRDIVESLCSKSDFDGGDGEAESKPESIILFVCCKLVCVK